MSDRDDRAEHDLKSESRLGPKWRGAFPLALMLALTLLLASSLLASAAHAITLADTTPLYFNGVSGSGFSLQDVSDSGLEADFVATALDEFIAAPSATISISQQISTIHQQPMSPTPADPAIIDSTWTITNLGAASLSEPLFVFTAMDPLDIYPGEPVVALDAGLMQLLAYSFDGVDYIYGVAQLPDLGPGDAAMITVRYLVGQDLIMEMGSQVLPSLGTGVFATYSVVPEPSTLMLSALGLAVALAYSRDGASTTSG